MQQALARIHREHIERRAKWARLAVTDTGINLRPTASILPWVEPVKVEKPPARLIRRKGSVPDIARSVSSLLSVTFPDLMGPRKKQEFAQARFIAAYICHRIFKNLSMAELGRRFGNRNHKTMIQAIRVVKKQMAADFLYAARVATLECVIRRQIGGVVVKTEME